MKRIATTYENGQIFQHFGRTESFKVYEVEEDKVVKSSYSYNNEKKESVYSYDENNKLVSIRLSNEKEEKMWYEGTWQIWKNY